MSAKNDRRKYRGDLDSNRVEGGKRGGGQVLKKKGTGKKQGPSNCQGVVGSCNGHKKDISRLQSGGKKMAPEGGGENHDFQKRTKRRDPGKGEEQKEPGGNGVFVKRPR